MCAARDYAFIGWVTEDDGDVPKIENHTNKNSWRLLHDYMYFENSVPA